ncbi:2323_t:CDS:2 [Entrophospora sp. SA101]|nr:2323_t:CDS:2 [Entrophospora sp. SA101]
MNDSDSALLECEWEYSIANCNYDTVLKNLYILSNILFLSVAIGGIILLFIRLVVRNSHLWDKNSGFFLPLEGYLLGISIFSGVRAFANFVQQFNLFASSPIARELIYDFSWIPADLTVATYLAGIALLKMYLHNFTSHQQPTKGVYLLPESHINKIYWTFFIIHFIYSPSLAIISGITRQNNDKELLNIIFGLHWSGFGIVQLLFAASAAYYGFKLVQLTKASYIELEDLNNQKQQQQSQLKNEGKKEKEIMKILNYTCIYMFLCYGISLILLSIFYLKLFNQPIVSRIFFFFTNITTPLCSLIALVGILQAEIYPRSYKFMDINSVQV